MPVSRLVDLHFRQLVGLEVSAYANLARVYEQFVEEAISWDAVGSPDGESPAELHRDALLIQVQSALEVMAAAQVESLSEAFLSAVNTGAAQTFAEVRELEGRFGSAQLLAKIGVLPPVIPAESVAFIADPGNLALANFRDATAERVSDALAQSILQGESIGQARQRLASEMTAHRWELERIARTEINSAMNYGHDRTISRVAADFPEMQLKKRWSSFFDKRTSDVCKALGADGGQIRETDEAFSALKWSGQYPPAHPNCRSRTLPHSERWEKAARKAGKALRGDSACVDTLAHHKGPCGAANTAGERTMSKKGHESKSFAMEFKALDEAGTFSGYASVFGNVDQGGDIVHPGAFKRTIQHYRQAKKRIPLLFGHETGLDEVVGYVDADDLIEDGKGLRLSKGVLMIDELESAKKAHALMRAGILTEMSFGYDAVKKDYTGSIRNLREVKLYEISLVLWPMNEESQVTDVKTARPMDAKASDFATILRRDTVTASLYDRRWKLNSALSDAIHGVLCDDELSPADAMQLIDDSLTQFSAEMMTWARTALDSGVYADSKTGNGPDDLKAGRRLSAASRAHLEGVMKGMGDYMDQLKALLADPAADSGDEGEMPADADSEEKGGAGPGEPPATDPADHSARILDEMRAWALTH